MEVEAQGKTFTFPEGTTNAEIGEAVDNYFASNQPQQEQVNAPVIESPVIQPIEQTIEFDAGTMVSNIPSSGAKAVGDIYNTFRHPVDTGLAINRIGTGLMQKLIPGEQGREQYADAAGQFFKDRYGGVDEFKQTLMGDPVGVISDIAAILSGGGMAAGKYGQKLSKVGAAIDPLNVATSGASKAVMNLPGIRSAPETLYKSTAKFPKKFDANKLTDTALKEGILPTDAGIKKARGKVFDINQQIDELIDASIDSGKRIPRKKLYKYLKETRREIGGVNLDAADNLKKLNKVVSDFEVYIKNKGKDQLTAREVQDFKSGIYATLNWKAKQGVGSQAKATTRKAIARAAKSELENIIPEIKGFNLRQGKLLELLDGIDAPAARIDNRDIIGLGLPAKVIAGSVVGGAPGGAAGFLLGVADSPTIKAYLAMGLNKIKNQKVSDARKRVLVFELLRNTGKAGQEEVLTE